MTTDTKTTLQTLYQELLAAKVWNDGWTSTNKFHQTHPLFALWDALTVECECVTKFAHDTSEAWHHREPQAADCQGFQGS